MHIRSLTFLHDRFPEGDCYPFNLAVFTSTEKIAFNTPVTFFIGENGTGKSTLLRAIARNAGIHVWEEHEGRRDSRNLHEDLLHQVLRIEWSEGKVTGSFFASEHFRHFAEALDQWSRADAGCLDYFGSTSLIVKSHGQSHMAFFENRFARKGLYLLDEPENALSPKRQLELLHLLRGFSKRGDAQFIIATHSPLLLALPEAEIFSFGKAPIQKVTYEDTDYYQVYRDFLIGREKYLGYGEKDRDISPA
ncbi:MULTISPECIES: AAA family ATPase [unclassified Methanoregula]|uniref:AAA family ATPase n=1 Tax=unclassified Methanoregula TaxID=2649730 RepID=UPI0009D55E5F|nr:MULTISPECIES: AAA family ATPase [unclassified Methanoregula]OPX61935.1 MAG: iron-dicitrate transporter ATP-binding subunit [Methanoregula sp. PtaB.Bin085]OPY34390.1 MAG: iron-dicitrate transporter ATP-binding subunit [Methanoregula sp. PtaU1.Bin006]